jgi:cation diffusion facilitator CzcD-associated flavoprotein CzcO
VEEYDALVVANGHHWDPRWPEPAFPSAAEFPGVQLHAHAFEDNTDCRAKSVLVVGKGNSAMDLQRSLEQQDQYEVGLLRSYWSSCAPARRTRRATSTAISTA